MHDIHEANKILKVILEEAEKKNLKKVQKIGLELGEIIEHGEILNVRNLRFNLRMLAKNTAAEGMQVNIKKGQAGLWKLTEIEGE